MKTFYVTLESPNGKEISFTTTKMSMKEIRKLIKNEYPKHTTISIYTIISIDVERGM
jgi:hypothetical protein